MYADDDNDLGPDMMKLGATITSIGCALTIITMFVVFGLLVVVSYLFS